MSCRLLRFPVTCPQPPHVTMQLTTAQLFEIERMGRAIEATTDTETLQGLCRQLLHA